MAGIDRGKKENEKRRREVGRGGVESKKEGRRVDKGKWEGGRRSQKEVEIGEVGVRGRKDTTIGKREREEERGEMERGGGVGGRGRDWEGEMKRWGDGRKGGRRTE